MSDFGAAEAVPFAVTQSMQKHPAFAGLFEGQEFQGKYLYYERITEENGDVWHLVITETKEGIIQFGIDDSSTKMQFLQPISINELRFYCNLSEDFRTAILSLADEIAEDEDIHDHYGPHDGHSYGRDHGHDHGHVH